MIYCVNLREVMFSFIKKEKKNQFAFSTVRSSAVRMRYRTFKAGCSPDGIEPRNNGSRGVSGAIGGRWVLPAVRRRDKRGGHGKGARDVSPLAASVVKCSAHTSPRLAAGLCHTLLLAPLKDFSATVRKKHHHHYYHIQH